MPNVAQIKCINKVDRYNPHERITHVGGYGTSQWKITVDHAISLIESGEWTFYVMVGQYRVDVIVSSHNGRKYLRTHPDQTTEDNLLRLPECP